MKVESDIYYQQARKKKRVGIKIYNGTSHDCTAANFIFAPNLQKNCFVSYCDPVIRPKSCGGIVYEKLSKWKESEAVILVTVANVAVALRALAGKKGIGRKKRLGTRIAAFSSDDLPERVKRGMKVIGELPETDHGGVTANFSFPKGEGKRSSKDKNEARNEVFVELSCVCPACSTEQVELEEEISLKSAVLEAFYEKKQSNFNENVKFAIAKLKEFNDHKIQAGKWFHHYIQESREANETLAGYIQWLWATDLTEFFAKVPFLPVIRNNFESFEMMKIVLASENNVAPATMEKILSRSTVLFLNFPVESPELKAMLDFPELDRTDKVVFVCNDATPVKASAPIITLTSITIPISDQQSSDEVSKDFSEWVDENVDFGMADSGIDLEASIDGRTDPFPFELSLEFLAFSRSLDQIKEQLGPLDLKIGDQFGKLDNFNHFYELAMRHHLLTKVDDEYIFEDRKLQLFLAARFAGRICCILSLKQDIPNDAMRFFAKFYIEFFQFFRKKYWTIVRKYSRIETPLPDSPGRSTEFQVHVQTPSMLKLQVFSKIFGLDFTGTYLYGDRKWFLKNARDSIDDGWGTISYGIRRL